MARPFAGYRWSLLVALYIRRDLALRDCMRSSSSANGYRLPDTNSIHRAVGQWRDLMSGQRKPGQPGIRFGDGLGRNAAHPDFSDAMYSLAALSFISRARWSERLKDVVITPVIVFADDIASPDTFEARTMQASPLPTFVPNTELD